MSTLRGFFPALSITAVLVTCLGCTATADALDPTDPADNIEAWVKLEGDTSGKTFYRFSRMVAYGLPDGNFGGRLFEIVSIRKQAYRKLDNGDYETQWWACGLYVDADTGEFIDEFVNPYNDEVIPLKPICSNVSGARYSVKDGMSMTASFAMRSSIFDRPYVLDWRIVGDNVVISREAFTEWEEKSSGKTKYETTIDAYSASLSELSDPDRTSVDSMYNYTLATEWMTMLKMGDRPGSMLWQSTATKHFDVSELPTDVVRAFKERFGDDVLDKPLSQAIANAAP